MNWAQFKDPVSHMCLAGIVVASLSLMQEVAGPSNCNASISVTEFSEKVYMKKSNRITFVIL